MGFSSTIISAITSLIPYWSNEIIKSNSLGSEYSMVINIIFSELIKFLSVYLTDHIIFLLIMFVIGCFVLCKIGLFDIKNISLFPIPKTISVSATEKIINEEMCLICSDSFKAINNMLIYKYDIPNVKYIKNNLADVVVNNLSNTLIDKDLYVKITKKW